MITLTLQCPTHTTYTGKIRPDTRCALCRLLFDVRNNTNRILSDPMEERTEMADRLIAGIS